MGFVADMFLQIVETFRHTSDPYHVRDAITGEKKPLARFWYPTVVLNVEIKKALPEEGLEWLFVRSRSKMIKNGRLDIEVVILDQLGDLVALGHQVALVLGAERNMAERSRKDGGGNGDRSKI